MKELINFLYRFRNFLLFLLLEGICFWLIVNHNTYQRIVVLTSASSVVGTGLDMQNWVATRWNLKDENERLLEENAKLHSLLASQIRKNQIDDTVAFDETYANLSQAKQDSLQLAKLSEKFTNLDSLQLLSVSKYQLIPAKVIKHSYLLERNFLTINKGSKQGIEKGMGVITDSGIVGKIEAVSSNYATVRSILHIDYQVASQIKRNGINATTQWDGKDYRKSNLLYTSAKDIKVGDTVVTSVANNFYPKEFLVGYIEKVDFTSAKGNFNEVRIDLATDFTRLSYVYVIENQYTPEIDSLEQVTLEK
ncbi:rod shape-determining protein MreC [Bernardetia sp.]|uniref:rod shape-determining protein MreC n=1 Tax=Bernardetia sp. TaxID=1937974 RepID=UPI0025C3A1B0|nr:rod shape-determining protein MreC [Bernardetia sp.]